MQRRKGTDGCGGPATTSPKMGGRFVCGAVQRAQLLSLPWRGTAWAVAQRSEKSPGRRPAAAPRRETVGPLTAKRFASFLTDGCPGGGACRRCRTFFLSAENEIFGCLTILMFSPEWP